MSKPFWIKNVSVISMLDDRVKAGQDVMISDGKIGKITQSNTQNHTNDDINATGKFLMPGLFDCHAHVYDYNETLPMFLANGITAIRDTGNSEDDIYKLRADALSGKANSPLIYTSGKIIEGDPSLWSGFEVAKNKQEVKQAIDRQVKADADFIKIYHTLPGDLYKEAIKIAKAHGKKVIGHVSKDLTPHQALQAGLDGIEHLTSIGSLLNLKTEPANDPEYEGWQKFISGSIKRSEFNALLDELNSRTTYFCPTIIVDEKLAGLVNYDNLVKTDSVRYMSDEYVKQAWNPTHKNAYPNIKDSKPLWWRNCGVILEALKKTIPELYQATTMLVGSDTTNPFVVPGFSLHEELSLLVDAGLTSYQALLCATVNPTKFLDLENNLGTVEVGKLANLILLSKNPLDNIANIGTVEHTFVLGKHYNAAKIKSQLKIHR